MDSTKVISLLEQLDDEVEDLEEALAPLLKATLSESSSKLPLLDKAKLYVLVTYAIESVLFSYLRLNGVNARQHPVFLELTRVKEYFDKIKQTEFPPAERNMAIDKKAAARFIKAGLSGNDKYDLERAEQLSKERSKAHIKFKDISKDVAKNRKVELASEQVKDSSDSSDSDSDSPLAVTEPKPSTFKKKKRKLDTSDSLPGSGSSIPRTPPDAKKSKKCRAKKSKQDA